MKPVVQTLIQLVGLHDPCRSDSRSPPRRCTGDHADDIYHVSLARIKVVVDVHLGIIPTGAFCRPCSKGGRCSSCESGLCSRRSCTRSYASPQEKRRRWCVCGSRTSTGWPPASRIAFWKFGSQSGHTFYHRVRKSVPTRGTLLFRLPLAGGVCLNLRSLCSAPVNCVGENTADKSAG